MSAQSRPEKEYIRALDNIRQKIKDLFLELDGCKEQYKFYVSEDGGSEVEYKFSLSIQFLAENNLTIEKVDSELGILSLLNDLRATGAPDDLVLYIDEFWKTFQDIIPKMKVMMTKYQEQIYTKLQSLASQSYSFLNSQEQAPTYQKELRSNMASIDRILSQMIGLLGSYQHKLNRTQMERSSVGSFAVIWLPGDLVMKMQTLLELSTDCINNDETSVTEVTIAIMEYRKKLHDNSERLEKHKQIQLEKLVLAEMSSLTLQRNQEMLAKLENDLTELTSKIKNLESTLNAALMGKERDKKVIEFLSHAIPTTKKPQALQLKQQKLLKSKVTLEKKIEQLKSDVRSAQELRSKKVALREEIMDTVKSGQSDHDNIHEQIDQCSIMIATIDKNTEHLNSQLQDIEMLHCVKLSLDNVDCIAERPSTVKIAKSIRDRVKKKHTNKTIQDSSSH